MAAPMKIAGVCLARTFGIIQNPLLGNSQFMPRALTHLQLTRGRRRSCKPPRYFVQKKTSAVAKNQSELTAENKGFLRELVEDQYEEKLNEVSDSPLRDGPWARQAYDKYTFRAGVLAVKIGVIPQWTKDGKRFFTTMLQVIDNHVIRYVPPQSFQHYQSFKPRWRHRGQPKYGSVVVGAMSCDPHLFTSEYTGLFTEAGVPPKRKLTRFIVTPNAAIEPGTPLYANHFRVGDYVDVQAKTIGHGFQGVVKRWGMKGGPASHGTTKAHRRMGAMGGGGAKKGIWKGKRMPGHMGMDWNTLKGLKVWRINSQYNVLYVQGPCVPGPTHCYVRIMDTSLIYRKEAFADNPPYMPTFYPEDAEADGRTESFADDLFRFTEPTIVYEEEKK